MSKCAQRWRTEPVSHAQKPERESRSITEFVGAIEKLTLENTFFRQVLFTAQHAQLVVMCLRPGEAIGDEVYLNVDQFFRIEHGCSRADPHEDSCLRSILLHSHPPVTPKCSFRTWFRRD
jgi:hypothetical protein